MPYTKLGGHKEGWVMNGKGAGRVREGCERAGGRVPIGKWEGRDAGKSGFPRMQRFPAQETRRDRRREGLASEVAEGRERWREESKRGGRD